MNNDFTSQISAFKAAAPQSSPHRIPPTSPTFWSQAAQQGSSRRS